jgi:hypothetical protein
MVNYDRKWGMNFRRWTSQCQWVKVVVVTVKLDGLAGGVDE